jgi:hypothetical protein
MLTMSPEIVIKTSSPLSYSATPPWSGIRVKEGLDVWKLPPGKRYFRHDRDSWATPLGQPFQIYENSFEEQMEADASAASPLNYGHDDKENNIANPAFDEPFNPVDGMSVMPASQYRRRTEDSNASRELGLVGEAFFRDQDFLSPYGLGGDGTVEEKRNPANTESMPSAMSILTSGEQLPRGPSIEEQAAEIDSVLGLAGSADSVLGSESTFF